VGRVPASYADEVEAYARKVERFASSADGREAYPLVMSDIASSVPFLGDIDAASALEVTISQAFPAELAANARRLYATEGAASANGGETISADLVVDAFAEGYALAFHNGHGSHGWMSDVMDTSLVDSLSSRMPSVMLSCACLSGNFADIADSPDPGSWELQGPDDDSAAERFILGEGGGVAYVGSTGTGLGPMGGSQMLHATLVGLFQQGMPTIGEALAYGRAHFREVRLRIMGFDMPQTDDSERWTQLVTILLGDPSLRPWTGTARQVALEAPTGYGPGYQELTARVTDPSSGGPVAGVLVVLGKPGDFVLRGETGPDGAVVFRFIPNGPAEMTLQANGPNMRPARLSIVPLASP
jgi:hypothetical protein